MPDICAGCGAVCDDVVLDATGCPVADAWLRAHREVAGPRARIGDREVDVADALARAAELLRGARRPLVFGFEHATVEAARAAVGLADALGAAIDTAEHGDPATVLHGASTATLGEIRDRAGVVVVWREDPETTHPRLLGRLRPRSLVVVDDADTATTARADVHVRIAPERDLELLLRLRAGEREPWLPSTGNLAVLYGPGLGGQRRTLALHELVRALNDRLHAVTLYLRRSAGSLGAEDALTWQTGYPSRVDLGSGHPELYRRQSHDVLLAVESDPGDVPATVVAVSSLPVPGAEVEIRTAATGLGAGGTVHRLDGVPFTLEGGPGAAAVLLRLREAL